MTEPAFYSDQLALDLSLRHFQYEKHSIGCIGTWMMSDTFEPCMVLFHAGRDFRNPNFVPCVIPLRDAWCWTAEFGDPRAIARTTRTWLARNYLPGTAHDWRAGANIVSVVQERLNDLFNMPPLPPQPKGRHEADLIITNETTGKSVGIEVRADV